MPTAPAGVMWRFMQPPTDPNVIFVFGSNLAGIHGAGSAKVAVRQWGAEYGVANGRTGQAYAIPTRNKRFKTLDLISIQRYVSQFLAYARANPKLWFTTVQIGCGLAGYEPYQIAPMFAGAPLNVHLPAGWRDYDSTIRQSSESGDTDDSSGDSSTDSKATRE